MATNVYGYASLPVYVEKEPQMGVETLYKAYTIGRETHPPYTEYVAMLVRAPTDEQAYFKLCDMIGAQGD